ncbi:MAG: TonB family protein [Acidobacteria bacterium]|nr:TonB family protein [Acidobacteriota bacterium]
MRLDWRKVVSAALGCLFASAATATPPPEPGQARPYYHLRIVRVSSQAASPGAALECRDFCGTPVVAPALESWGTPAQLREIARILGGDKGEAVGGLILTADDRGQARFEGTIYPGPASVKLEFTGAAPREPDRAHDLAVRVVSDTGEPLAESRLLARAESTIAIAAPSPVPGEWIVVAATPVDPAVAEQRIRAAHEIRLVPEPGTGADVTPPKLVHRVTPLYPQSAKHEHRTGKIVLQAVIDSAGAVQAIRLLSVAPGGEDLAAAAVDAVRQWRYEPATVASVPTAVYFTIVVNFQLE